LPKRKMPKKKYEYRQRARPESGEIRVKERNRRRALREGESGVKEKISLPRKFLRDSSPKTAGKAKKKRPHQRKKGRKPPTLS